MDSTPTKIIVDDSIIHNILKKDNSTKLLINYVFWKKDKLLCTDTMKQKIVDDLKNNNDAFQLLKGIIDFEDYDFKEEHITAEESIIQYINTSSRIYDVIFLTEKEYKICQGGSNDKIREGVTIFKPESFNEWVKSKKEFIDWLNNLTN